MNTASVWLRADRAVTRARSALLMAALVAGAAFGLRAGGVAHAASGDAGAPGRVPAIRAATVATILAEARASRAPVVLVNVWATWCDPCREEMPDLLRFYRDHRGQGLRLVLLSADDDDADASAAVAGALAEAASKAGVAGALDTSVYLKADPDMKLIDALDPHWSGALPATFLFDRGGHRLQSWLAPVSYAELERSVVARLTKAPPEAKRRSSTSTAQESRRKP